VLGLATAAGKSMYGRGIKKRGITSLEPETVAFDGLSSGVRDKLEVYFSFPTWRSRDHSDFISRGASFLAHGLLWFWTMIQRSTRIIHETTK